MKFKSPSSLIISFILSGMSYVQVTKAPADLLITHDPYFSKWSFSDQLNESAPHTTNGKQVGFQARSVVGGYFKLLDNSTK